MKAPYSSYSTPLPGYGTSLIDRINVYLHFRRYLKVVTERWLLLVIFTVIGTAVGVWMAVTKPDQFRATSVLATPQKISLGSQNSAEIREIGADNTLALMLAEPVLQRTLAKLQEGRDNTNKLVRPGVGANAAQGGMFVMTVTSTNFEYAQKFAAVWAQEFVDFKKQQRKQLIGTTEAINTQTLLQFEKKFEQAQSALDDFQKKNYPSGLVDAGDTAQRAYDQARAELATLTSELREAEESTAEQHAAATGMQRWFDLKLDVKRAENRLAASPEDAAAKADLALRRADVKSFLELTDEERVAKVASIRRKADRRAKQVRELGEEIFSMTSLRSEYQRLKDDEKRMLDQVAELRSRATSLDRIGADDEQLNIIQSGGGDPHPVGPNRPMMVLTGLLSGGLIGLLLVGLRALFGKPRGPGGPGTPQGLAPSGPVLVHG